MTAWTLLRRNLFFHARAHLGVLLGAAIGSAVLVGALVVGDSVRESLRQSALRRLGWVHFGLNGSDRFFQASLRERLGSVLNQGYVGGSNVVGRTGPSDAAAALVLRGVVARQDGTARGNRVNVIGVESPMWSSLSGWELPQGWDSGETALVNETLARQLRLRAGDEIVLRVLKPTLLGLDTAISPRNDNSVALRLRIGTVLTSRMLGDFSLVTQPEPPANLFLPLAFLAERAGMPGQANLVAFGGDSGGRAAPPGDDALQARLVGGLERAWQLEDANVSVRLVSQPAVDTGGATVPPYVEVTSGRVFLDPPAAAAALSPRSVCLSNHFRFETDNPASVRACQFVTNGVKVLTYLANLLRAGDRATPYSIVTAADSPLVPADLGADEILVNEWLGEDLQLKSGDRLELSYYVVDSGSQLIERTNSFRVRAVVPLKGIYGDRSLMPEFPGLAKAESTHDWDTGFPLVHKIREKDEAYWKQYRGTPKAFISLAAGQAMWANRFGELTAIRYPVPSHLSGAEAQQLARANLIANLRPGGMRIEAVREAALRGVAQAQDFGQLFLGFSLFLIAAALLLMGLLFRFNLEQRAVELGTLLALGFSGGQLRGWLLLEGVVLGGLGGLIGVPGGVLYAKGMLWGLATIWRDAVGNSTLGYHASVVSLALGSLAGIIVAVVTLWLTLRKRTRLPARLLLSGGVEDTPRSPGNRAGLLSLAGLAGAVGLVAWTVARDDTANAGAFFGAGSLLLVAGVAAVSAWLSRLGRESAGANFTLGRLGLRGCARRRSRTLATIAMLGSGSFVIVAIGAFHLDAQQGAARRTSGTGGFAVVGESALPVVQDLNTQAGRDFFGLSAADLDGVEIVPVRVRSGDEASCRNLTRAQIPRLLGVRPERLAGRFTFAAAAPGSDRRQGWELLKEEPGKSSPGAKGNGNEQELLIPAIGDANAIQWALGKKLGDTLDYTDERGRPFKVRLVGAVANSLLQGSLVIDEARFVERFPGEGGSRMFFVDAPSTRVAQVSAALSRALEDAGIELIDASRRLSEYNAIQNTYLATFAALGGLGLLLGSAGLGIVVRRNVLERRGELACLQAVGFRRKSLALLVLGEHAALLGLGLGLGIAAAVVAVLPAMLSPTAELPWLFLTATVSAVFVNGAVWTWFATQAALRGNLLSALRNE